MAGTVAEPIDGVVLAGGASRRFGRPKATVALDGVPLVVRAVSLVTNRCALVVVVTRAGIKLPALDARVEVVHDRPGPDAPLVGLATGLAAVETADVLVLACDLPFAEPLLDRLLAVPAGEPAVAVEAPTHRPQPLCARYPRVRSLLVAEELLEAGELRLTRLLARLAPVREVSASGEELLNINRASDLDRAVAISSEGRGRAAR